MHNHTRFTFFLEAVHVEAKGNLQGLSFGATLLVLRQFSLTGMNYQVG